ELKSTLRLETIPLCFPFFVFNEFRHPLIDKFWQPSRGRSHAFVQTEELRLPARAIFDGTRIADVIGVALKRLRGGRGNGGSAGHRKTERSDRRSKTTKAEGDEATGAASSPLVFLAAWCFG